MKNNDNEQKILNELKKELRDTCPEIDLTNLKYTLPEISQQTPRCSELRTRKSSILAKLMPAAACLVLVLTLLISTLDLNNKAAVHPTDTVTAPKPTNSANSPGANNTLKGLPKIKNKEMLFSMLKASSFINEGVDLEAPASTNKGHHETNVQVNGIDEADIVKTDGSYIYYIMGNRLFIIDAGKTSEMKLVTNLDFNNPNGAAEVPVEMYLDGNRLAIVTRLDNSKTDTFADYNSCTNVKIFDITNRSDISLIKEFAFKGWYFSSRKIGNTIYVIGNNNVYYYPEDILKLSDDEQNQYLDYILPKYTASPNSTSAWETVDLSEISYFSDSGKADSIINIACISMNTDEDDSAFSSFLASGYEIYCSKDALYITGTNTNYTDDLSWNISGYNTEIYKFVINELEVSLAASATVPGTIINQFSMDEYNGLFRIATTKGAFGDSSENNIYILDQNLELISSTEDLAKGERIYAVRFMGDLAYMVTFKQVDPLFIIDLSNPRKPEVTGELKIPGYSSYLHPIDDSHLIGFGMDADEKTGSVKGFKLSLFDVSDLENPKELFNKIISGDSSSTISYNHKVLTYIKDKNILALPVQYCEFDSNGKYVYKSDLFVYSLDFEKGFTLRNKISHPDSNDYMPSYIYRGIYIGDTVYTLSENYIQANSLSNNSLLSRIELK